MVSQPSHFMIIHRGCNHNGVSKKAWVQFKRAIGYKCDLSWTIDDDDAKQRSSIEPIIYHFDTWRRMEDLSYKKYYLKVYRFI